jgi:serine/threonine protein kinase
MSEEIPEQLVAVDAVKNAETPELPVDWVVPPSPGEVITSLGTGNTYTIGDKIGEGGFGTVFGCKDHWNNDLAAKVLKARGTYETVKNAAEGEFSKLILLRHPHITYLHDAFEYRDTFYLVTERCYCPIERIFLLPDLHGIAWIKPIARCLLQALQFMHNNGYVHQDIHPGNVFASFARGEMGDEPSDAITFKVGDFGVTKLLNEIDSTNTRALWMLPPEVLNESEFGPIDHRQDIYHCGLLFLQLAYNKELQFTQEQILAGEPRQLALQLEAPFNFALEKSLRRHSAHRTASAMEMWRDLNSPVTAEDSAEPTPDELEAMITRAGLVEGNQQEPAEPNDR